MTKSINPINRFNYNNTISLVYKAKVGEGLPKHEHTFAHTTVCIQGSMIVRKENKEKVVTMYDNPLLLTANEWHEIEALENDTIFINQFPDNVEE